MPLKPSEKSKPAKRKKRKLPAFLHGPATVLIRSALTLPLVAGPDESVEIARGIGNRFAKLPFNKKRLRQAMEHLEVAFPAMDIDQRRALAIRSYEHLFALGAEFVLATRMLNLDSWIEHLTLGNLGPGVRALTLDRPCILITGHVGNWELIGYTIALLGFPMHAIYRPLDNAPLDRWVRRARAMRGLVLVSKFGAMKELPPVIKRGAPVGFVADQNGGDRGVFVPFFGRLASTYKSVGLLAMQADASIVCGYAKRLNPGETPQRPVLFGSEAPAPASGLHYCATLTDVFGPEDWSTQPDPLFYLTARYRRAIEHMIRQAPEQYLWMHRIWRARPPHERQGKPFPPQLREKLRALPWMTDAELALVEERSARDGAALHR
ncbi:MAG: lysophospholipid acyltransferase family protein [Planctomycetota bacterium]|nr:lysophospholipid acyltransferase family protein [Planctomycetota bacterium]